MVAFWFYQSHFCKIDSIDVLQIQSMLKTIPNNLGCINYSNNCPLLCSRIYTNLRMLMLFLFVHYARVLTIKKWSNKLKLLYPHKGLIEGRVHNKNIRDHHSYIGFEWICNRWICSPSMQLYTKFKQNKKTSTYLKLFLYASP